MPDTKPVRVAPTVKSRLDDLKEFDSETYNSVIERLADRYEATAESGNGGDSGGAD